MSEYMSGYRDGFRAAHLENAEEVYESQCDALEKELARLAAYIQRRHPATCKKEMRDYVSKSRYFAGFCEGYTRAKQGARARDASNRARGGKSRTTSD